LKAYRQLQNTGAWPRGFISEGMEFPPGWQLLLMSKMTEEYLRIKLDIVDLLEHIFSTNL
jgi:hypothetical protein